ncbi:MAG: DHH family phosphoesterase [Anaerolineae bacterium]
MGEKFQRIDGMMALAKHWLVAPAAEPGHLQRYRAMSPVLAQILYNRGLTDPGEAYNFLLADDLAAGSLLAIKRPRNSSIDRALTRIRAAIKARERIVVFGDFDADGVTSTALLVQALERLGADVHPYIPHRVDEGYGLNSDALLQLARAGTKLVITVDCGIRSVQEVEDGNAAGLDMIITDHHSVGADIPNALAVINPKLDDCAYSEDMLAGVGVAYRLAEALYTVAAGSVRNGSTPNPDELLDLVAIGTVADLVPLNRLENRMLVRRGLALVNRAQRPGLRALMNVSGLKPGGVGAEQIGYGIAPRINAAGRLETAMIAYELLATGDWTQAELLASQLQGLNMQRQEMTRAAQELVRGQLTETSLPLIRVRPAYKPGIVNGGGAAGRGILPPGNRHGRGRYRKPCLVPQHPAVRHHWRTRPVRGAAGAARRGHARRQPSPSSTRISHAARATAGLARTALDGQDLAPTLNVDLELDAKLINLDLATELLRLEPTGHGNPTPVFVTRNLRVQDYRTVGRDEGHLKLKLGRYGDAPLDAIGFNLGDWTRRMPPSVDLAYQLEINEWNGSRTAQMNILDMRPAERA